jgi:Flp pilus assembly protein TadG
MKRNSESFVRRARKDQRGQMLILAAASLVALLGFAGLAIDVGRLYYSRNLLQASTDAAALAGAQKLPDTAATAAAIAFSGVLGSNNARSNLPNVTMASGYPRLKCSPILTGWGVICVAPANANAIQVKQQVPVATTFMRVFGISSVTLTATATAAMRGSARSPYNVAIVMDTTASMDGTRIRNAMNGAQVLLKSLSPCPASASSCGSVTMNGSGGNVANPVDRVALYAYPPVTTATVANDYNNCSGSPTTAPYATPLPSTSTSQIVNFSSDYRTSDTAVSLSSSSNLVKAVGATSSTGCLEAKGGFGTYYAQAIDLAQRDLVSAGLPNTQNVIIVLSDGDGNATCDTSSGGICKSGDMPGASTTSGTYMSTKNECHQAVTMAQAATAAGTRVYTIAYGASNSGCSTDTSPYNNPCYTLQQMASKDSTFFKDSSSSCSAGARPTTDLNTIFTQIAGDLTVSRLIPDTW